MADEFTAADAIDEYRPPTAVASVCTRGDLVAELERLEAEWQRAVTDDARTNARDRAPEIEARIAGLHDEAERHEREFVFASIGDKAWGELEDAHPPSKKQSEDGHRWAPETFIPAAIAACSLKPPISEEQALLICAGDPGDPDNGVPPRPAWSPSQVSRLFAACNKANGKLGDAIPKGSSAIARRLATGSGSTSASGTAEASPPATS